MRRVLILAQPGEFGRAWGRWAASRLAQRLQLPCLSASEIAREAASESGWVATTRVGACPEHVLRAADTAVWLHFSPFAVLGAWWRGLRGQLGGAQPPLHAPRLADVQASLLHLAWTPHVQREFSHPAMAHLRVVHLRDPAQTDFWLRLQELRLHSMPPRQLQAA